ncbi:MAG TPA: divalent-cation tolerance protein CutA [Verrucomicrobiae bacterium]|nr:divalent-cation tolerance protein CutA [Verrucomicrobiae bacterium]
MRDASAIIVLVTASTEKEAAAIAEALVGREEAACVNVVPMVRSVYRWKGKVWNETEQLLVIKTTPQAFEDVKRTVKELHSYELPEILAVTVADGEPNVLAWIASSVKPGKDHA